MPPFSSHPFFKKLLSLNLPREDFAIAGSGPMYARNLIDKLGDVDVIARGKAWETAVEHGRPVPAPYSTVEVVKLFDESVEILDGWFPEIWSVDDLFDNAELIDGIQFVSLEVVRRTKEKMRRPKDVEHIAIIDKYLNKGSH